MENFLFYAIAGMIAASALLALTLRNLFHCALFLALTMFGISGIFLYLSSEFLAAVQVLIYVGAVTVIIIFGISLTRNVMDEKTRVMNGQFLLSIVAAIAVTVIVFKAIQASPFYVSEHPMAVMTAAVSGSSMENTAPSAALQNGPAYLANALIRPENGFAFSFEFVSILLLSALVGAIVIARKDPS
jgi:NADH-quinone oxidoreductase subunit J